MAILRQNNLNFGTSGDVINATNSASGGDAFNYISGSPTVIAGMHGLGANVGGGAAAFAVGWQSLTSSMTFQYRFYFKRTVTASATTTFFQARSSTASAMAHTMRNDGKMTVIDNAGASQYVSVSALTTDTWYRVEGYGTIGTTTSNGAYTWNLYAGDSTTAIDTYTSTTMNLSTAGVVAYRFGKDSSANTLGITVDDLMVGNSAAALGPYSNVLDLQYPTSMVTSDGWTQLGAASPAIDGLFDSLDTTGYRSPSDPSSDLAYFTFGALTPNKPVKVSARHMASSSDGTISRLYELRQGASTVIATRTVNPLPTVETDYTFTTTTPETANITDWNNLRIYITDNKVT